MKLPAAPPANVHIAVRAVPKAYVSWGKKSLGLSPVTLERPRDSGPIDLVLRAKGYLTVHTRAYSFRNESLVVQMTRVEDSVKLLGARIAPPPVAGPVAGAASGPASVPNPDGGVR